MPIRRKATDAGIFDEFELALLGRVFEQLKLDNSIARRSRGNRLPHYRELYGRHHR